MVVNLLSDLSHVTMLSDLYLYLMFFEQSCIPLVIGIAVILNVLSLSVVRFV
ncbi:hypothetical protein HanPSC8_Chr05g0188311 [Helianthus annuus]|nr:hypothetical protein HanPSC8_Chr05g0188311 [Helianthus annuus]